MELQQPQQSSDDGRPGAGYGTGARPTERPAATRAVRRHPSPLRDTRGGGGGGACLAHFPHPSQRPRPPIKLSYNSVPQPQPLTLDKAGRHIPTHHLAAPAAAAASHLHNMHGKPLGSGGVPPVEHRKPRRVIRINSMGEPSLVEVKGVVAPL